MSNPREQSNWLNCDVDEAKQDLQQLRAENERLKAQVKAQQPFVEWVWKWGYLAGVPSFSRTAQKELEALLKTLQEQEGADKTPVTPASDLSPEQFEQVKADVRKATMIIESFRPLSTDPIFKTP